MARRRGQRRQKAKGGALCRKCEAPMQRYRHAETWRPPPGKGYYRFWDLCPGCGHLQHYGAAYVAPEAV